jgi:hypothetical protein
METKRKQAALLRLFTKFPASSALGEGDLAAKVHAYCETLESCAASDVEYACIKLGKADSAFIPSAGQVYTSAQENAATRVRLRNESTPRLPRYEMSQAKREEMKSRFNDLLDELKAGKYLNEDYGKLQPGEPPRLRPIVERRSPPSWLEKWERENGRPYYPVFSRQAAE